MPYDDVMSNIEPVSWSTACNVARRVGKNETFSRSYLVDSFSRDMQQATELAESLVATETGLVVGSPARVRVRDRGEWSAANVAMFRRILRPLFKRMDERQATSQLGSVIAGVQLGAILGWMSARVLGQYEMLYDETDHPEEQDILMYVAPNILQLEKRYAFAPDQFRLWIAIHECTHRAQFCGVPWLTDHFRKLVGTFIEHTDTEAMSLDALLRRVRESLGDRGGKGKSSSDQDDSMIAMFTTPEQRGVILQLMGLMALLEGHGEVIMSRAAGERIPDAERFHRVMQHRRANANGIAKLMQRIIGMDVKLKQYAQGESFIKAVESHGGEVLFARVWERPEHLPTMEEIRTPQHWIDRIEHRSA